MSLLFHRMWMHHQVIYPSRRHFLSIVLLVVKIQIKVKYFHKNNKPTHQNTLHFNVATAMQLCRERSLCLTIFQLRMSRKTRIEFYFISIKFIYHKIHCNTCKLALQYFGSIIRLLIYFS